MRRCHDALREELARAVHACLGRHRRRLQQDAAYRLRQSPVRHFAQNVAKRLHCACAGRCGDPAPSVIAEQPVRNSIAEMADTLWGWEPGQGAGTRSHLRCKAAYVMHIVVAEPAGVLQQPRGTVQEVRMQLLQQRHHAAKHRLECGRVAGGGRDHARKHLKNPRQQVCEVRAYVTSDRQQQCGQRRQRRRAVGRRGVLQERVHNARRVVHDELEREGEVVEVVASGGPCAARCRLAPELESFLRERRVAATRRVRRCCCC